MYGSVRVKKAVVEKLVQNAGATKDSETFFFEQYEWTGAAATERLALDRIVTEYVAWEPQENEMHYLARCRQAAEEAGTFLGLQLGVKEVAVRREKRAARQSKAFDSRPISPSIGVVKK